MNDGNLVDELYRYNDWANGRILRLCEGLSAEQLDRQREMGMGTLRATIFHNLVAEEIWYERWTAQPWRTFPFDPEGLSLEKHSERFQAVAERRRGLIDQERASGWQRRVKYLDSKKNEYSNCLIDLLMHVANHATHHRAQALNYLKQFDRRVAGGLDYIFYKLAHPSVAQDPKSIEAMQRYGLEVATAQGSTVRWDRGLVQSYFAYHDWANRRLIEAANHLDDAALDRDFAMGIGTIRKTLLHLYDAERWWLRTWTSGPSAWEDTPQATTLAQLSRSWADVAKQRNAFVEGLDDGSSQRVVTVHAGGPAANFRVIESLIQLCCHGTHHRAQLVNMQRHSGIQPIALDYVVWVREKESGRAA